MISTQKELKGMMKFIRIFPFSGGSLELTIMLPSHEYNIAQARPKKFSVVLTVVIVPRIVPIRMLPEIHTYTEEKEVFFLLGLPC